MRSFNSDNPFSDAWRNLLIFGDNLLALKAIYEDQRGANRYGTKNKIKLIYIDPPFATKQDFMKDREKAYRDKVMGAQFIEFIRERLVLLREVLADDGSIYVHLDWKKVHYIKAVMDEVFGEYNFQNEIVWKSQSPSGMKAMANQFSYCHETILWYSKSSSKIFNKVFVPYTKEYIGKRFTGKDERGLFKDYELQEPSKTTLEKLKAENRLIVTATGKYRVKQYLDDSQGVLVDSVWTGISAVNSQAEERQSYPTQKPEKLISRVIEASSNENDIILDAFAGSGTTLATAEKLNRRWIGMDCGKLAIYTIQKRLLNLTINTSITKDDRLEHERVNDFTEHSKSNSRGLLMVYDKARRGDLLITDALLEDLANFTEKYLSGNKSESFSLVCPEDKLQLSRLTVFEDTDDLKAGEKAVTIGRITFLISFITPKNKTPKPQNPKTPYRLSDNSN
jgi:site-specific DNA-methyltransferase (adenine-specific)/adenine-specific DNA-methyltransferase